MTAQEIRAVRAMLAAHASEQAATKRPKLGLFTRLFTGAGADDPAASWASFASDAPDPTPSQIEPAAETLSDDALLLGEPVAIAEPNTVVPSLLLLGDLALRRDGFGQKVEVVLELREPAPAPYRRLKLKPPEDIATSAVLATATTKSAVTANGALAQQIGCYVERLHAETPFFPEDLEDASVRRSVRTQAAPTQQLDRGARMSVQRRRGVRNDEAEAEAAFLLAGLAARLAHEESEIGAQMSAVA